MNSVHPMGRIVDEFKGFYGVHDMPFSLVPNTDYFVALPAHDACYSMLMFAVESGEGFIKITGEVGTGKTLLCRRLLNGIDEKQFYTAYLPNPRLTPMELKRAVAKELGIAGLDKTPEQHYLDVINDRLINLAMKNKQVLLVIDEAQALPLDTLEELRLLTNLETEHSKLIQIVMFGQPELDDVLQRHEFRQLRQRISYSGTLPKLGRSELIQYLQHRMSIAGYNGEAIFDSASIKLMLKATQGIPRLINIVCSKSLLIAFGLGCRKVKKSMVKQALKETEGIDYEPGWIM